VGLWELKKSANLCQSDFLNKALKNPKIYKPLFRFYYNYYKVVKGKYIIFLLILYLLPKLPKTFQNARITAQTHETEKRRG